MTQKQSPAPGEPGAASPAAAVTAFLAAVKLEDLQAMSAVWGTSTGSVRNEIPRVELEEREIYIIRCVRHDRFLIAADAPGQDGRRILSVQITRGPLTRSTNFTAVVGPKSRWYVEKLDLVPVDDICRQRP